MKKITCCTLMPAVTRVFTPAKVCLVAAAATAALSLTGCGGGAGVFHSQADASGQVTSNLTAEQRSVIDAQEANRKRMEALIAEVEKANAIQRDGSGTASLTSAHSRAASISSEAEDFAKRAVEGLNEQIQAGKIRLADDLTVTATDTTRGNEQGVKSWHWWGVTYAVNITNTNRLIALLGWWGGGAGAGAGAAIGSLFPGGGTIVGAIVGGLLGGFPGFVVSWYASPGQGIYVNGTWWAVVWLQSQH